MRTAVLSAILALAMPLGAFAQPDQPDGARSEPQSARTPSVVAPPGEFRFDFEQVIAHPEAFGPVEYAVTVQRLWERGDRARAFFWSQVFSARTVVLLDVASQQAIRDGGEDEAFEFPLMLRLAGWPALQWAMSDPQMAMSITARAYDYESHLPPHPQAVWSAHASQARSRIANEMVTAFDTGGLSPRVSAAQRRKMGLYIGPWQDSGSPLDDAWR